MRQKQWTTIFWEELDGAGALRGNGVLSPAVRRWVIRLALAGGWPLRQRSRPLGRVVALGGEGPRRAGRRS